MKQPTNQKNAVLWTGRAEIPYLRPPQLSAYYKAARSLVGIIPWDQWQMTVSRPVMYLKLLVTTAVQKTRKQ